MNKSTALNPLESTRLLGRAMADNGRLRILAALRGREICVCHLAALLGLDQSTISRHLAILREAGLILARRAGRWVHYRRVESAEPALEQAYALIDGLLEEAPEVVDDQARLNSICCVPGRQR